MYIKNYLIENRKKELNVKTTLSYEVETKVKAFKKKLNSKQMLRKLQGCDSIKKM